MWWKRRWGMLAALQFTAALAVLPYLILPQWADLTNRTSEGICVLAWFTLGCFSLVCAWAWPQRGFEPALWLSGLLVAPAALVSALQQVQVLNGLQLLILGMFAAFALPVRRVHIWLAVTCTLYVLAVTVNSAPLGSWLAPVIAAMVVITTTVVQRLLDRVREASTRDPLTGAANRSGLRSQATQLRSADERRMAPTALAYLDLDGFKQFNDAYGHASGDALLVEVVAHLRQSLRSPDVIARVGGDEFVLVLSDTTAVNGERILERVCSGMPIACSYGVAGWPHGADLEAVMHVVDALMYAQKQQHHAQPSRGGSSHERLRPDFPRPRPG